MLVSPGYVVRNSIIKCVLLIAQFWPVSEQCSSAWEEGSFPLLSCSGFLCFTKAFFSQCHGQFLMASPRLESAHVSSSPALGSSGHSAAGKRCSCAFANYSGMSTLDLILLLDVASFGRFWSDVTWCRASRALGSIGCKTLGRAVCTIYPERAFS